MMQVFRLQAEPTATQSKRFAAIVTVTFIQEVATQMDLPRSLEPEAAILSHTAMLGITQMMAGIHMIR